MDCYTDSTDRDHVTIGGESTSQEMCFSYLFHYPAIDLRFVTVGKSSFALETWMKDAQQAGYINSTFSDIEQIFDTQQLPDLSSLSFNGSMDGALEFYNRLYSVEYEEYNQHTTFCIGKEGLYNDEYLNVARDESFEKYDLGIDQCENAINADHIDVGTCIPTEGTNENPNGSVMRMTVSRWVCIILLIPLIIV